MSAVKEKLIKAIQKLDEETAKRLLDELDDILLEIELTNDPEFMNTVRSIENGTAKLTPHEEILKEFQDD